MRLCYVNINAEKPSQPLFPILEELFGMVAEPGTEIVIKAIEPGLERATDEHPYFYFLNKRQIVETVIEAERAGYDAVIVACFLDPGVAEARSVVNIPVIGLCEATLHFACLLGKKFGIVTLNTDATISAMEDEIRHYGLADRAIPRPVRGLSMSTFDVFVHGLQDPKRVTDQVIQKARECVSDGAETVIIGCAGMGPMCTVTGIVRVDEHTPLIDCVPVGIKTAEMLVSLRNSIDLPFVSRKGFYALPREKDMDRVRSLFGLSSQMPVKPTE